jgi:hypothetical protein
MDIQCASVLLQVTLAVEISAFMRALANKQIAGSGLPFLLFLVAAQAAYS